MQNSEREFNFTDEDFQYLARLVNERTGIVLGDHKRNMVYSRLARRLRSLHLKNFSDYRSLLNGPTGDSEAINFVNAITTNLTAFFREGHHFEHLRDEVLKPLAASPPAGRRLRIWSAACSGGQEPYSIAMVMKDVLPESQQWDAKILATDIDTNMLDRASDGIYKAEELEKIPALYRKKYVLTEGRNSQGESITMAPALKECIRFNKINLLENWPMKGPFDVIFCRNVVIYFDKDTQRTLFNRIADILKPDGWLYIGHSENLFKVCDRFSLNGRTIYQRIK